MKTDKNFFKVWGGISGVQYTLPLLLTEARVNRNAALPLITDLLGANVARRFQIPTKGKIAIGLDADFALVDLKQSFTIAKDSLFYRHRQSPYIGRTLTGRVVQTILRGKTIFKDGKIVSSSSGRLVKPQH